MHGHKPISFILELRRRAAVPPRRPTPALVACRCHRHVHPCPHPHALVRPHPLALSGLTLGLAPSSTLACVPLAPYTRLTTIIAAAALSTTTAAIDGGYGGHCRLRLRSMAAAEMASLLPPSTTTIRTISSIPLPPALTKTGVNEDRHRRCQRRQSAPSMTMTTIAAFNDDDWRCWLHHTAASVNDDCQ